MYNIYRRKSMIIAQSKGDGALLYAVVRLLNCMYYGVILFDSRMWYAKMNIVSFRTTSWSPQNKWTNKQETIQRDTALMKSQ